MGRCYDFLKVDFHMLPSKVSNLLYGAVLGSHIPFLTVFFVSVGMSTGQAGFINGMRFAPAAIAGPLWGMLADYTGRRKLIVVLLCLGSAIPFFSMPWISYYLQQPAISHNTSHHDNNVTMATNMAAHSNSTLFYVTLVIVMIGSVFVGPLPGYIDSTVMNVVKTSNTGASYGGQRIFGSLGFSLASFISGVAADNFSVSNMSRYTAVFFLFLPCALMLIPFGWYIVDQSRWDKASNKDEETPLKDSEPTARTMSQGSQIFNMLTKFDTMFFLGTAMVSGLACNLYVNFTIILTSDVINDVTQTELSLTIVIGTAAEVLLFPFTTQVIRIIGGTSVAMTVGTFSYFVRFVVMSYTHQLWIMLAMQCLHAFGFALTWAAMMDYLHDVTPSNVVLTMFLIFQSVSFGVAALAANVAGGYLYDAIGGQWLFRGMAIVCGIWSVFMTVYYGGTWMRKRFRSGYERFDGIVYEVDGSEATCSTYGTNN